MKSRFVVFTALAAVLLLSAGAGCGKKLYPPEFVWLPDTFWTHVDLSTHLVSVVQTFDSARYVVDWGDGVDTTEASFGPGDTAYVSHVWQDTGRYEVRTRTLTAGARQRLSAWSAPETVHVVPGIPNSAPVIDSFDLSPWPQVNVPCTLVVFAHDPDGDSLGVDVRFGNSDTVTSLLPSPCTVRVTHVFTQPGTASVIIRFLDWKGSTSFPETIYVSISNPGGVIWYWQNSDPENPGKSLTSSPVVASDGTNELLFSGCKGDHHFYSIRTSDGRSRKAQTTRWVDHDFTGQPAFCEATQHIIVGSDEGELYALRLDGLQTDWQWPNKPREESLTGLEWGAPAIKESRLYVPHQDDSLFYFIDSIDHGVRVAAFTPHASFVDAPVIDAQGNVYFGTDSGYLYKVGPELDTVFWRTRLLANGAIHSPIIGGDGTIYCASDFSRVYAIDPASGTPLWTTTLDGDPFRLALGQSALFVASSFGKVYSINPATGTANWDRQLSQSDGFYTTPVVAANGYVYFQSDADVLYCVNQADGTVIWPCNCPDYLPRSGGGNSRRPRKVGLNDYAPNPTILSNGNVIVVGADACYCVAGYPEGPLDPHAPWPKWQHDLYNTGYVGGGK